MRRDDKDLIYEIKDSIEKIILYTSNIGYNEFVRSYIIQDAVLRRFEVISSVCSDISDELKDKIDFIPWNKIIDLKLKLVNEEHEIYTSKVWEIIYEDLPLLKDEVVRLINEINQNIK